MNACTITKRLGLAAATAGYLVLAIGGAQASTLNLQDTPLFLQESAPPLNLLVMGRDHKLYYEAYNDASDLDGDGTIDAGYQPDEITYFGLFDSFACYTHDGARFNPVSLTADKKCGGSAWSGDFLNYVTTSRIDALRKVLYGGSRHVDPATGTVVLARSHIPQDAHSWGKEYESVAVDGYDIREYTPLPLPGAGRRHLFANTTVLGTTHPRLRMLHDVRQRIWEWVSIEREVTGGFVNWPGTNTRSAILESAGPSVASRIVDLTVRLAACVPNLVSTAESQFCRTYPNGSMKPIGLLQRYGESDSMLFGLLTGSYDQNTEGGVLRRNVSSIRDEIDPVTGQFLTTINGVTVRGVIRSIDALRVVGFGGSHAYTCGWVTTRPINPGECRMWGNPVGEMMYEAVRYFANRGSPTARFVQQRSAPENDATVGLPQAAWQRPFDVHPRCAKPFVTVISDINPSYDMDSMPGSPFNTLGSGDLPGFDASRRLDTISSNEPEIPGQRFIGEVGALQDGRPTPKTVTTLANVRGLSPEEPTKQGGYSSAAAAYHANVSDLVPGLQGKQNVQTFAVALASPLPRIEVPFGDKKITLVPFAKSVGGSGINALGTFQPTNQIVDFYFDRLQSIPDERYVFRINYEDVEQGADHDMDAVALYVIEKIPGLDRIRVTMESLYAAGTIIQHMGYVISGTQGQDGIYLEIRDLPSPGEGPDPDYALDTPPGQWAGTPFWDDNVALPLTATREFDVGSTAGADLLRDPLFYAAKWGGFVDGNNNNLPDDPTEWNQDGDPLGTPDNYFLVTNALKLNDQLTKAFDTIIERATSASSVALNSGSLSEETRVYQAKFNSGDWTGQLLSFKVNTDGSVPLVPEWDAATELPAAASRRIITLNAANVPIPFRWASLDPAQRALLDPLADGHGALRLDYLRGDPARENAGSAPVFRPRTVKLGDIVSSSPVFVGTPRARYKDSLEPGLPYTAFRDAPAVRARPAVVYAGANDGMLHAFDATDGRELFAYVPRAVFPNLARLTEPSYTHKFFVDGSPNVVDAVVNGRWRTVLASGLNNGGQAVFALDVTSPGTVTEATAADLVLWEFDDRDTDGAGPDAGDRDLGYTHSRPAIGKLRSGAWAAVFGNGYNSTAADGSTSATGNAVLYIVGLGDGQIIRKIDTGVGAAQDPLGLGRPNGLASVNATDLDEDGIIDFVYAGDLFGNLWKFDLTSASPLGWDVAFSSASTKLPLFVARNANGDPQPITSRPLVGRGPRGAGMLVLFGTGKYLEPIDKDVAQLRPMSFYGLYDRNTGANSDRIARAELLQQQITAEETNVYDGKSISVRVTTDHRPTSANRGWFLDLQRVGGPFQGEMQVSDAILRSGRVIFTTLIPSADPCDFGGDSWLMALDALTGARVAKPQFDLNFDGEFDDGDKSSAHDSVTGIKSDLGIINRPGIVADNQSDVEYIVASGTGGKSPQGIEGGRDRDGDPYAPDDDGVYGTRGKTGEFDRGRQSWRQLR